MTEEPWRLELTGQARRDLERLPAKVVGAVLEAVTAIASDPHRLGKPLRFELEGLRAARRGPYRILYQVEAKTRTVTVVVIDHRADVYRRR